MKNKNIKKLKNRFYYLARKIKDENISYLELAELESLGEILKIKFLNYE